MTDPTESSIDLTEKILDIAQDSGFKDLIDELTTQYNLSSFELQSNIPIPLELMDEENIEISTSEEASQYLAVLLEMINEPGIAKEYPFLLTGNTNGTKTNLSNISLLYSEDQPLKERTVSTNDQLLGSGVWKAVNLKQNVFVLGHTHPKLFGAETSKVFTSNLKPEIKEKYKIAEAGLNLSLQDLYMLVSFQEILKDKVPEDSKVYLTVLMFNGDMNAISIENGKFKKTKVVYK